MVYCPNKYLLGQIELKGLSYLNLLHQQRFRAGEKWHLA